VDKPRSQQSAKKKYVQMAQAVAVAKKTEDHNKSGLVLVKRTSKKRKKVK